MPPFIPSIDLVDPVLSGNTTAIARLLTRAENGAEECYPALAKAYAKAGKAHIVGITGVPGSGKSTLVAKLAQAIRKSERTLGILAIDPSSPFSGGSILGDRIRMADLASDTGVFIRSMATRGSLGGLARGTYDAIDILDAAGFDMVLIETVGVGQDEVDVVRAAHTTVVVSAPGLGDEIQAIKAGVLEIADIHAVSKCDKPEANKTISDLKGMLAMGLMLNRPSGWQARVIATSSTNGEGIDDLLTAIDGHWESLNSSGEIEARRKLIAEKRILKAAEDMLRDGFERHRDGTISELTERMILRHTHPHDAAKEVLKQLHMEI
jgi:LAO/AO transport system kinase